MEPSSREELYARARALEGRALSDLARERAVALTLGTHGKGSVGALLERALGATAGSAADFDFPSLEVELKSVPMGAGATPRESTYVCTLPLLDADRAEWRTSWVRRKLSRVLFVPFRDGVIERAVMWEPTREDEALLKQDFDEIMGLLGTGGVEVLSAKIGAVMQVRPKAAHGGVRTDAIGPEDAIVRANPRGFYLRARFVGEILSRSSR